MEERNNLEIVKRLRESATIQSLLAQVKLLKNELKVFKICEENCQATLSAKVIESDESKPTYKQPPPPPPLPNLLLNCLQNNNTNISEQRLKTFGDAINDAQLKLLHFPTEKLTINATGNINVFDLGMYGLHCVKVISSNLLLAVKTCFFLRADIVFHSGH